MFHVFSIFNKSWREISSPSLDPLKLETLTFLQSKKICVLRTIISSLVNKNNYYLVILFLCYVFPFAAKDYVFPLLLLSTHVLLFDVLTILIHYFVLFFRILIQKEKFYVKKKNNTQSSSMIFFPHFMTDGHYFKWLIIYQSGITMNINTR